MSDLIDRQATIDTLDKHLRTTDVPVSYPGIISALTEWLNELPSAQADSKELSGTHKALDTVSRQAVIELIQGSICDLEYSDENRELCNKVRALPPSPSRPPWIPCSERLPEHRLYVLVTYKYEYGLIDNGITWYSETENKWNTSREVIAWMPLPEPYAERRANAQTNDQN